MTIHYRCLFYLVLIFLFITPGTPAFAQLSNTAVFNWVEYKFPDTFPKSAVVESELTHDGVHYDLRSWSGAWGTRYLGITEDGEIVGFGDYTDWELLSFGYIVEWEDAINADADAVLNSITSVSTVVSPVLNYPDPDDMKLLQLSGIIITEGMDGLTHIFVNPSDLRQSGTFTDYDVATTFELVQAAPGDDHIEFLRSIPEAEIMFCRDWKLMDTERTDLKRFVIADTGFELNNAYNPDTMFNLDAYEHDYPFGYVWIATDYGNGFEFEKANPTEYRGFYHTINVHDMTGNGYDDIAVINMGIKDVDTGETINELPSRPDLGTQFGEGIHTYLQDSNNGFSLEGLFAADESDLVGGGSVTFVDLDNDGEDELVQSIYDYNEYSTGHDMFMVWQMGDDGKYHSAYIEQHIIETFFGDGKPGCYRSMPIDYNKDGYKDLVFLIETDPMDTAETIEIYRNNGDMTFTRVTEDLFTRYSINKESLWWRGATIVDVNNDGWDDIVVNGHGGYEFIGGNWEDGANAEEWNEYGRSGFPVNIGSCIFLNQQGQSFKQLIDIPSLTLKVNGWEDQPEFIKFMSSKNGVTKFFAFSRTWFHIPYTMVITMKFE